MGVHTKSKFSAEEYFLKQILFPMTHHIICSFALWWFIMVLTFTRTSTWTSGAHRDEMDKM